MSEDTYHRDIVEAEENLEHLKVLYLQRWGWKRTCNTPGAHWLWVRDFSAEDQARHSNWKERGPGPLGWPSEPMPYGVVTASTDLAVSMTVRTLDEQPENASEDDDG